LRGAPIGKATARADNPRGPLVFVDTDTNLCGLSLKIGDELQALAMRIDLDELVALSSDETVCWAQVLAQANRKPEA